MVVKHSSAGSVEASIIQTILDEYGLEGLLGDQNHDGLVNIQDVILIINFVLNDEHNSLADLNSDEIVNIQDIILIISIILEA